MSVVQESQIWYKQYKINRRMARKIEKKKWNVEEEENGRRQTVGERMNLRCKILRLYSYCFQP